MLGNTVSITRFKAVDSAQVTDALVRQVPDLLKQYAFCPIDKTAEERSFGWANYDDQTDLEWLLSPPEKGEFITFGLRVDVRKIPASTMKLHVHQAVAKELEQAKEQGKQFVSRDRKREIKEQVMLRLRAKTVPQPAFFPIVWAPSVNRIYLCGGSAKIISMFMDYFQLTFEMPIEPLTGFFMAHEVLDDEQIEKVESLDPTIFI